MSDRADVRAVLQVSSGPTSTFFEDCFKFGPADSARTTFDFLEQSVPPGYTYIDDIASGCFGEVVRAKSPSGEAVAVKRTYTPGDSPGARRGAPDSIPESEALRAAAHGNVVRLLDVVPAVGETYLILELCVTDLEKALSCWPRPLSESVAKALLHHLLSAVEHCHSAGLLHRDVKPANLLLDAEGTLKLADFGHARWHNRRGRCSPAVASRWYRAPELLYGSQTYGPAVDIWAIGCVFAELLGVSPLFCGSTDIEQLSKIRSVMGSIDTAAWPAAMDLPDFCKLSFAPCDACAWATALPHASSLALDLLAQMLRYDPADVSVLPDLTGLEPHPKVLALTAISQL